MRPLPASWWTSARSTPTRTPIISGGFDNRADFVIGAPGQSLYRWCDVNRLAIAVVDEFRSPWKSSNQKYRWVQNGSMQLKIVAHRKEGFKNPINVQFPFHPPGLSAASSVNIPEGQTEVLLPAERQQRRGGRQMESVRTRVRQRLMARPGSHRKWRRCKSPRPMCSLRCSGATSSRVKAHRSTARSSTTPRSQVRPRHGCSACQQM